jgi:hypothetical protein
MEVTGIHELVANALVFPGEKEKKTDLRERPLKGVRTEQGEDKEENQDG